MGDDSDSDFNDDIEVPSELLEKAKNISLNLLPQKSKIKYTKVYNDFKAWCKSKHTSSFAEEVVLVYFEELSTKFSSATLWSRYSMLKSTINNYNNVDISKYKKLLGFLKQKHNGYMSKKSKVFTAVEISTFFNDAQDNQYLDVKAAFAIGVCGACRTAELVALTIKNIEDHHTMLLVKIPTTKTGITRSFTIHGTFYEYCKKYMNMRPPNTPIDRFFLNYQMGKCTRQPIGKTKMSKMPMEIAKFLDLPNPELYTGHSYRRTSATLLVDGGGDILALKRHGGWKSDTVAQGYIEDSIQNKSKITGQITSQLHFKPSTSTTSFVVSSTSGQNTIQVPPPCENKRKRSSSVPICNDENVNIINIDNNSTTSIIDVPENFFDEEMEPQSRIQSVASHTVNIESNDMHKKASFNFNDCNVTINLIDDK